MPMVPGQSMEEHDARPKTKSAAKKMEALKATLAKLELGNVILGPSLFPGLAPDEALEFHLIKRDEAGTDFLFDVRWMGVQIVHARATLSRDAILWKREPRFGGHNARDAEAKATAKPRNKEGKK